RKNRKGNEAKAKQPDLLEPKLQTTVAELDNNNRGDVYRRMLNDKIAYMVSKGGERGGGDSIHSTLEEAKSESDLLKRQDESHQKMIDKEKERVQKEADKEQVFQSSTLGKFLGSLTKMAAGRARKALSKTVNHRDYGLVTKAEWIEKLVEKDYTVQDVDNTSTKRQTIDKKLRALDKGMMASSYERNKARELKEERDNLTATTEKRLVSPDGEYEQSAADITKFGMDYAETLADISPSTKTVVDDKKENTSNKPTQAVEDAKIEDFGEKIGGAAKDNYTRKMEAAEDMDITAVPFSKSFPEPNYQKLVEAGANLNLVSLARALRDSVADKPRGHFARTSMMRKYTEHVEVARGAATTLLNAATEKYDFDEVSKILKDNDALLDHALLYEAVGHDKSLKGIDLGQRFYSIYKGEKDVSFWSVETKGKSTAFSNIPRELGKGDTKEEAIKQFKAWHATEGNKPKEPKGTKFNTYKMRATGKHSIGKDIGRNQYFFDKEFDSTREARAYLNENHTEIDTHFKAWKEIPEHRRDENNPRLGEDHRDGKDVDAGMFTESFGFRGVEFGNWVSKKGERQNLLNNAYDSLMDMALLLNIPTRAISLGGELGLAFGARGRKGAAAHYEMDNVVINLTRKQGAGSLAHEWWHALDNYISRNRKQGSEFMSEKPFKMHNDPTRQELIDAFKSLQREINRTSLKERSSKLDGRRTKAYWGTGREMSARSFESYIIHSFGEKGHQNDYLANIISEANYKAEEEYPYIKAAEIKGIKKGFDNLFKTLKTKETDKGTALYSRGKSDGSLSPLTDKELDAIIKRVSERLSVKVGVAGNKVRHEVIIVDTFFSLPATVSKQADKENHDGSDVGGVFHKGKVYVVRDNLAMYSDVEARVETVLLHEFVHADVRAMFGTKFTQKLNQLYLAIGGNQGLKAIAKARGIDLSEYGKAVVKGNYPIDVRHRIMMAELLAHIGQVKPNLKGKIKEIIGAIRQWLRSKKLLKLAEYGETDLLHVIATARKQAKSGKEGGTQFIRVTQDFGKQHSQFKHDAQGAIKQLMEDKGGEAVAALHHPDVGDIDLVWGKEGTGKSDGFGLAKLVKYHPEVLDDLQGVLDGLKVKSKSKNRIILESVKHRVAVSLNWKGEDKKWLLSSYELDGAKGAILSRGVADEGLTQTSPSNTKSVDAGGEDVKFSRSTPEQYAKDIKSESEALLNRATEGKGSNTLVSGIHHLISYAYYRPVQIIRDFGTPTARLMMDMVYKEEKNGARVLDDHDFIQRRQQKNGEYMQKVSRLIDKIDGTRAQRKKKQASIIDVLNGGTTYESMKPLAGEFRALFDEMLEYQKEAGLEIKPLDHYFPRVYDVSKLTKLGGKLAFVNMLNKAGYNGDKIWANIVENDGLYQINDTTDRFEVDKDDGSEVKKNKSASPFAGRHQNDGFTRKQSFEKQRKLDLPYADLEPFLINELDSIMGRHIHGLTTRAEYARIFGKNEGKLNKMVRDFAKEYSALPRSDKSVTLNEAIDEIYA
ncbi:MAG: LPD5 domain-containing protein, partial [Ghiorsea sp.]